MKRRLWSILCIAILCLFFWKTGNRYESESLSSDVQNHVIAESTGDKKQVALTFDDGPKPSTTKRLLDGLKARGVTATFFVIGASAENYPELILQMSEDGHMIGNHSYHHVQLNKMSIEKACKEVEAANQALESILGYAPVYLRPPFGEWNRKEACIAEMIPVYWNIDPLDWKTSDADLVAKRVLSKVKDGDIILLHDVYDSSVDAAFLIIDELLRQGYEFVTVDELFFD